MWSLLSSSLHHYLAEQEDHLPTLQASVASTSGRLSHSSRPIEKDELYIQNKEVELYHSYSVFLVVLAGFMSLIRALSSMLDVQYMHFKVVCINCPAWQTSFASRDKPSLLGIKVMQRRHSQKQLLELKQQDVKSSLGNDLNTTILFLKANLKSFYIPCGPITWRMLNLSESNWRSCS